MKGATDSDRRESSVLYRMGPKHTSGPVRHARLGGLAVRGTRVQITPTPQKRLPTPFMGIGGDAEWVGCGRSSLAVRGTRNVRALGCHRQRPKGVVGASSHGPEAHKWSCASRTTRRPRCAWHRQVVHSSETCSRVNLAGLCPVGRSIDLGSLISTMGGPMGIGLPMVI